MFAILFVFMAVHNWIIYLKEKRYVCVCFNLEISPDGLRLHGNQTVCNNFLICFETV